MHDGCLLSRRPLTSLVCVTNVQSISRVFTYYATQIITSIQTLISCKKFKANTRPKSIVLLSTALKECCLRGNIYASENSSSSWHVRPWSTVEIQQESFPVGSRLSVLIPDKTGWGQHFMAGVCVGGGGGQSNLSTSWDSHHMQWRV